MPIFGKRNNSAYTVLCIMGEFRVVFLEPFMVCWLTNTLILPSRSKYTSDQTRSAKRPKRNLQAAKSLFLFFVNNHLGRMSRVGRIGLVAACLLAAVFFANATDFPQGREHQLIFDPAQFSDRVACECLTHINATINATIFLTSSFQPPPNSWRSLKMWKTTYRGSRGLKSFSPRSRIHLM